jgi:hypothetical protein
VYPKTNHSPSGDHFGSVAAPVATRWDSPLARSTTTMPLPNGSSQVWDSATRVPAGSTLPTWVAQSSADGR